MPQWRRTLYTVWLTQFIAVAGFSFVMPFIPYYIQELGVSDLKEAGLWAALVTSAQAISMALIAPVWGALADGYGRKMMVLRASFAGALVMSLMGFVTSVQQHEGVVFGLDSSAVAGANALGPIMGATVAAQMGLRAPFVLATLMFGVGTLAVVL
jgi:DHA1 family multidrug resistance protein-like MFS transporter